MGVWDVIYSAGDRLKGITPDLSTAKRAGTAAYGCTSTAVTKIDQIVRVNGVQKLHHYLSDDDSRAQIVLFTTTLAKHTGKYVVQESYKHIPGVKVATKLISDTMLDMKGEIHKDGMKEMQAKIDRLEEAVKNSTSQQLSSQNWNLSSHNGGGGGAENTKDMIDMFMKTEFVGNHMFRDLLVPNLSRTEKQSIED